MFMKRIKTEQNEDPQLRVRRTLVTVSDSPTSETKPVMLQILRSKSRTVLYHDLARNLTIKTQWLDMEGPVVVDSGLQCTTIKKSEQSFDCCNIHRHGP
ncbi:hypothetical protein RRG08_037545 [Elysia crispata]|uniref:Uncharacterized protein n=1 Tax=Elysia crispata TaxID=231223 RepID=A0AAE0Y621_9GAST|nr:hypothetical protein RRG08_037545 [Elysia crispata]